MGGRRARGRAGFGGFLFPIFTMGNVIASPMVKCFRFACENFTTFPFGKRIVAKLDSWAFWWYIQLQDQIWGLREISKVVTIVLRKLTLLHLRRRLFLELGCAWPSPMCAGLAHLQSHSVGRRWCGIINSPATTFAVVIRDFRSDAALFPNYFGQTCYYYLWYLCCERSRNHKCAGGCSRYWKIEV